MHIADLILLKRLMRHSGGVLFCKKCDPCLVVSATCLKYLCLHLFFSSHFTPSALMGLYAYDMLNTNIGLFYIFSIKNYSNICIHAIIVKRGGVGSLYGLIPNVGWYEREVSEFFGVCFYGSRDTRRLFLAYGCTSTPLCKVWGEGSANGSQTQHARGGIVY